MACAAQSMLSASGCIFLSSKPQGTLVRGSIVGGGSSRPFLLTCGASSPSPSSPPPAPTQEDSDCNEEECAPEKEVGSLSAEWLAEERTKVVGTFPPKKKGWTGYVEKDTAGQTNIYSVEPTVYVAESAISSGAAGTSAEGAENTAAIAAGLVLITVAAASSILIQVSKNQPAVQAVDYSGPPLSYYVAKFQPAVAAQAVEAPAPAEAVGVQDSPAVQASAPETETASTVEASAASDAEQLSS
ncbi:protein MAINTENANCE OF PSII UNDER HIGH LIGHT 1-like [Phragmites australis]|uniref:protein MAINTENANCE OF PSII UNDER HIGH LIGHT 1-like n=1 Tax=Phragmites australis TaxID=29695 RepID=UPI002D799093|nr:protein MAINTENANCE OF PSII UNDER HIGH LIGHT 1-like [Phragmites australis]